jgi:heterodisulfide reductase subunit B
LHLLEILCRDIGLARVAAAVRRPLSGLKVACYYGCLLVRPPEITNFDDPENPTLMDQLMQAAGAPPLAWPHKTECCGASFSITDSSVVLELGNRILAMAQAAGADCIATACPLCQLNLDLRQRDMERKFGCRYNLPVFYFTQLLGLAMGCRPDELSLDSLIVEPKALLEAKGIGR